MGSAVPVEGASGALAMASAPAAGSFVAGAGDDAQPSVSPSASAAASAALVAAAVPVSVCMTVTVALVVAVSAVATVSRDLWVSKVMLLL
jgi:hypothetical protein